MRLFSQVKGVPTGRVSRSSRSDRFVVQYKNKTKGEFTQIKVLGQGSFGVVYLVRDTDGNKYAMKQIAKNQDLDEILNEIAVLDRLRVHCRPLLLCLVAAFEDDRHIYLVTDYVNEAEELFEVIDRDPFYHQNPHRAWLAVSEMFKALDLIHSKGVVHRDLKPENLLWVPDKKHPLRLIDFGLACKSVDKPCMRKVTGTPFFMDPRIRRTARKTVSKFSFHDWVTADMWSAGLVAFEVLGFRKDYLTFKSMDGYVQAALNHLQEKWKILSKDCVREIVDTLALCVSSNPASRPSAQVMVKRWLRIRPCFSSAPSHHSHRRKSQKKRSQNRA